MVKNFEEFSLDEDGVVNIHKGVYWITTLFSEIKDYIRTQTTIKKINIPQWIEYIDYDAFSCLTSLEEINVDKDNAEYCSIDGVLFSKDKKLLWYCPVCKAGHEYTKHTPDGDITVNRYEIPAGVEIISDYAFAGCKFLEEIIIPDGVKSIELGAFSSIWSLKYISIPDSVKSVTDDAFQNSANLVFTKYNGGCYLGNDHNPYLVFVEVDLHADVDRLFYKVRTKYGTRIEVGVSCLKPHSDTKIIKGDKGAMVLKIFIPENVSYLALKAFSSFFSLQAIEVDEANAYYCSEDGVMFTKDKKTLICYPMNKPYERYIVPESVTSIAPYAFFGSKLKKVILPENYKLNEDSFIGCGAALKRKD